MQWLRVLGFAFFTVSLGVGCAKGRDVKSAGKEDKLAFDEEGHGKQCDTPSSSCEEVKDQSLDFKEKCREAGFRMKQCGCENLCTGNINGQHIGFNSKNEQKICEGDTKDNCQVEETSAAYQDACDSVGGEMMECGCHWLCSKRLKAAIPDAPKEDAKTADDSGDPTKDDKAKDDKAKDEKPHGNMDGKAPEPAKDASKDKSSKDKSSKSSKDKSSKDKSSSDDSSSSSGSKKKHGRFFDPDETPQ
jgi:hypothetical protein